MELDRLGRLRAMVAGLSGPSVVTEQRQAKALAAVAMAAASEEQVREPKREPTRKPRQARVKRSPAVKRVALDKAQRALTGTIPKAPVVVPAAVLQKEHAAKLQGHNERKQAEERPEPGSLGSMIRALQRENAH